MSVQKSVLVVCLNPTFQMTMVYPTIRKNEVNRTANYFISPSGKGVNVARVLTQLGRRAKVLTHVGGNRIEEFRIMCTAEHIALCDFLEVSPIRTCTTLVDEGDHTSTEMVEEPKPVSSLASGKAMDLFRKEIPNHQALVITGTKAKGYDEELYPMMVAEARKQGKLIVLDLKGEDLKRALPYQPTVIKPNLSELVSTFSEGLFVSEQKENRNFLPFVEEKSKEFFARYRTCLVVSRGKYPSWVFNGEKLVEIPGDKIMRPVVNTIGCGDALTAGMTHRLLDGDTLEDSVRYGMHCALKNAMSFRHGLG